MLQSSREKRPERGHSTGRGQIWSGGSRTRTRNNRSTCRSDLLSRTGAHGSNKQPAARGHVMAPVGRGAGCDRLPWPIARLPHLAMRQTHPAKPGHLPMLFEALITPPPSFRSERPGLRRAQRSCRTAGQPHERQAGSWKQSVLSMTGRSLESTSVWPRREPSRLLGLIDESRLS